MNDYIEMEVEVFEEVGSGAQKPETSRYFVDFSEMTTDLGASATTEKESRAQAPLRQPYASWVN